MSTRADGQRDAAAVQDPGGISQAAASHRVKPWGE